MAKAENLYSVRIECIDETELVDKYFTSPEEAADHVRKAYTQGIYFSDYFDGIPTSQIRRVKVFHDPEKEDK